jgi:hypothetical protein
VQLAVVEQLDPIAGESARCGTLDDEGLNLIAAGDQQRDAGDGESERAGEGSHTALINLSRESSDAPNREAHVEGNLP